MTVKSFTRANEYLVYTRRSTDDLVNQQNSIEYQVRQCMAYAGSQRLAVADETIAGFCEKGVIAERHTAYKTHALDIRKDGTIRYSINRPKFQKLVTALASREYCGVICLCWDRLSRNPHDDAVIKDLIRRGVDVRFVLANYDQSSSGALHMDIDGVFASYYSRTTSDKVRAANAKLRAEGKCTNRAPLGYLNKGPSNKPLDPERAPIIRKMFEMYALGNWSVSQLTNWANENGLTTAPQRLRRTSEQVLTGEPNTADPHCGPVTVKGVEKILKNSFYAGVLPSRSGFDGITSIYEPLVSMELFQKVQRVHAQRTTSVHYLDKPFFLFRGFVKCDCARAYSPYEQKGYSYYTSQCVPSCSNARRTIGENRLHKMAKATIRQLPFTQQEMEDVRKEKDKFLKMETVSRSKRTSDIDNKTILLKRDLSFLQENKLTLLREGVYSAPDFSGEMLRLEMELDELEKQKEVLRTTEPEEMLAKLEDFLELLILAEDSYEKASPEEKHSFLSTVFLELTVVNGELARVKGKGVFDRLLKRRVSYQSAHSFVFLELPNLYQDIFNTNPTMLQF